MAAQPIALFTGWKLIERNRRNFIHDNAAAKPAAQKAGTLILVDATRFSVLQRPDEVVAPHGMRLVSAPLAKGHSAGILSSKDIEVEIDKSHEECERAFLGNVLWNVFWVKFVAKKSLHQLRVIDAVAIESH
jgi:hypothetical protein